MELNALYNDTLLYVVDSPARSGSESLVMAHPSNQVVVVFAPSEGRALTVAQQTFLHKILESGMQLLPAETTLINRATTTYSLKLLEELQFKRVIVFGMDWVDGFHNMRAAKNTILHVFNMAVLFTDDISVIYDDTGAKKNFWAALKQM